MLSGGECSEYPGKTCVMEVLGPFASRNAAARMAEALPQWSAPHLMSVTSPERWRGHLAGGGWDLTEDEVQKIMRASFGCIWTPPPPDCPVTGSPQFDSPSLGMCACGHRHLGITALGGGGSGGSPEVQ